MTADNVTELQTGPGTLDKAALLAATDFDTDEVHIPGFGMQKVRALSRAEMQRIHGMYKSADTISEAEAWLVATASIDPTWTVGEVKKWQAGPLGAHIDDVVEVVNRLSGIGGDVGPDATEQFPE